MTAIRGMVGANPESLAQLNSELLHASRQLDLIRGQVSAHVTMLHGLRWKGTVADHFAQTWQQSQSGQMQSASVFLAEMAARIAHQIDEQLGASAEEAALGDIAAGFRAHGLSDGVLAAGSAALFGFVNHHIGKSGVEISALGAKVGKYGVNLDRNQALIRVPFLKTEMSRNWRDHSWKVQALGVGVSADNSGRYSVLSDVGIDLDRFGSIGVKSSHSWDADKPFQLQREIDARAALLTEGVRIGTNGSLDVDRLQAPKDSATVGVLHEGEWHNAEAGSVNGVPQPIRTWREQTGESLDLRSTYFGVKLEKTQ